MATATPGVNPYAKPNAAVAEAAEEYQEVKVFSTSGRIGRVRYIAYAMGMYFLIAILGTLLSLVSARPGRSSPARHPGHCLHITIQRCHDSTPPPGSLRAGAAVNLTSDHPRHRRQNRFGARTPPNGVGVIIAARIVPIIVIVGTSLRS
jgi:hypothetical protein